MEQAVFFYAPFTPPYSPERYKEFVYEAAETVGPDGVVIVDSLSHAWNNEGGVLDIKDRIAGQQGKNSYTAWNEAGKFQNDLINTILAVDCHTIVTMRSKMEYAMQENERGKMAPVKVGLAPVQRDDTEYEFDIVLDIARNHIATASKDTTFLDKFGQVITPELGKQLADWLNTGAEPARCEICKKIIAAKNNKSVQQIIEAGMKNLGKMLCYDCFAREFRAKKAEENKNAG